MKLRLTRKKCVNKKKCTKKKCTNKNRVTRKHHTHGGVKLLNRIKGLTMNNKLTMQKLEMYITYQTYATFEYDTINNVYNSIVQSLLINMKK